MNTEQFIAFRMNKLIGMNLEEFANSLQTKPKGLWSINGDVFTNGDTETKNNYFLEAKELATEIIDYTKPYVLLLLIIQESGYMLATKFDLDNGIVVNYTARKVK